MKPPNTLITASFLYLVLLSAIPAFADFSCNWHEANDLQPDFPHYDVVHDSDGDGIGCEQITGIAHASNLSEAEIAAHMEILTTPAVPSVELLANSNFRRGPGLSFAIVGGGTTGSVYEWTSAQYGSSGWIWYKLVLPAGEGWVRGDLIKLLDADDIPEPTPNPADTP